MFQLILPFQLDLPLEYPGDASAVSTGSAGRSVRAPGEPGRAQLGRAGGEPRLASQPHELHESVHAGALAVALPSEEPELGAARRRKRKVRTGVRE